MQLFVCFFRRMAVACTCRLYTDCNTVYNYIHYYTILINIYILHREGARPVQRVVSFGQPGKPHKDCWETFSKLSDGSNSARTQFGSFGSSPALSRIAGHQTMFDPDAAVRICTHGLAIHHPLVLLGSATKGAFAANLFIVGLQRPTSCSQHVLLVCGMCMTKPGSTIWRPPWNSKVEKTCSRSSWRGLQKIAIVDDGSK